MFWLWLALNYLTHMQLTARYEGKGGGVTTTPCSLKWLYYQDGLKTLSLNFRLD